MRAVLDSNVIVSATLSRDGAPGKLARAWLEGAYDLVVSPVLLGELRRVFEYPKIAERVTPSEADELLALCGREATRHDDPAGPPVTARSPDKDDDDLIALGEATRADRVR